MHLRPLIAIVLAGVAPIAASIRAPASALPSSQGTETTSDFNGDGFDDLAVSVPFEDVEGAADAGAVSVLYGAAAGLSSSGNQIWTQSTPDVKDKAEDGDFLGWDLATGDFDGDGFFDLAIGVPFEHLDAPLTDHAGAVNVLYGSEAGLTAEGNQRWTQDSPGIKDVAEGDDEFGAAVAAGDLNGDGYADLAVGARGESLSQVEGAGAVHVLLGSAAGLTSAGNQFWTQRTPGVEEDAYFSDLFGVALAIGDLDGDGFGDLAIGANGEDLGEPGDPDAVPDAGAVNVLYGSAAGPTAEGDQLWSQDSPDIDGIAETPDLFGSSLATGDFDGDGYHDLAVGAFGEDAGPDAGSGAVNVIFGSAVGLTAEGDQLLTQDSEIPDATEPEDHFGASLAAGDFDGDGFDDLAAGVEGEDLSTTTDAGAVNVIHGSPTGLNTVDSQIWTQNSPGPVLDNSEDGDAFGSSLAAGRFGDTGHIDLSIGVRTEDVGAFPNLGVADAGAANVLYGSTAGLTAAGNQFWHQDSMDVVDQAEEGDWFGFSAAGV
jgi:FG-GAP repeat